MTAGSTPAWTFRALLTLGAPTNRNGLHLAPVLRNNPISLSPAEWGSQRCAIALCAGITY